MGFVRFLIGVLAFNALLGATANLNPNAIYDLIWRNAAIVAAALVLSMIKTSFRWAKSYVEFRETCEKFPAFLMKDLLLLRQLLDAARGSLRGWAGKVWGFVRWLGSLRLKIVSNRSNPDGPQLPGIPDPEPEPDPTGGGNGGGGAGWRQVTQRRRDGSPVNWKIRDGGGIQALLDRLVGWLRAALGQVVPGTAAPRRLRAATASLLAGTILSGLPGHAAVPLIVKAPEPKPMLAASAPDTGPRTIRSLRVEGSQRIEPDTVLSYTKLRVGGAYIDETIDQAIKDLLASELLADVQIEGVVEGNLIVRIRENPVVNRVVFEGNKRLKQEKIEAALKVRPRQIFTPTAVRADVSRLVDLYRQQGRFAATVEPTMVSLDQNRVDLVYAIVEGPVGKVRGIDILGAAAFSERELRKAMAPERMGLGSLWADFEYDADRLAVEQAQLRDFYLTRGYADFRVISAVAELTSDKKDFIVTYEVKEGQRYRFAKVGVDSRIPGLDGAVLADALPVAPGQWYDAKAVEDAVALIATNASDCGYASAEIVPVLERDASAASIDLTIGVHLANRTFIERIDVAGEANRKDKPIRREFRVAEGDAFNTFLVARSQDRINSLGYFQDKFVAEDEGGLAPDRIALKANVEQRDRVRALAEDVLAWGDTPKIVEDNAKGELTLSAGFSSLEQFILQASIRQRNFRGKGQTVSASVDYSNFSKSIELGFTEPYLFDQNIALGGTVFRRDYNAFNYIGSDRSTTYSQVSTGFQLIAGVPLTEYWTLSGRYSLQQEDVTLDKSSFYSDFNGNGVSDKNECDPVKAGRYYCEAVGSRITSLVGLSLINDRPNGSRVQRIDDTGTAATGDQFLVTGKDPIINDAIGGKAYYLTKAELEIPLGAGAAEMGLRPSVFVMAGSLFNMTRPGKTLAFDQVRGRDGKLLYHANGAPVLLLSGSAVGFSGKVVADASAAPWFERFVGDAARPRLTIGFGVNWNSPFGPMRIDVAKALLSGKPGEDEVTTAALPPARA